MIRFRKMSIMSNAAPVVIGPNNQTEIRRTYAIALLPINDAGDAIVGGTAGGYPGMPGVPAGMNGQILIPVANAQEMNRYPDDAILILALDEPAALQRGAAAAGAMTSSAGASAAVGGARTVSAAGGGPVPASESDGATARAIDDDARL